MQGPRIGQTLPRKPPATTTQLLVVSLSRQQLTVYQDGEPVSRTRVSSGKDGHRTPTGIFSIIQKRRFHRSNIYSGAPMPFMQRITWSGIALHQGMVPNYRASHGCIRLPASFASGLFAYTRHRSHVVIAHDDPSPAAIRHAALFTPTDPHKVRPTRTAATAPAATPQPVEVALGKTQSTTATGSQVLSDARPPVLPAPARSQATLSAVAAILDMDSVRAIAHRRMMHATRETGPLRILVTRRSAPLDVSEAQQLLKIAGYDVGEIDGIAGNQTVAGIKAYQTSRRLPVTGTIDKNLMARLRTDAGRPAPAEFMLYVRQDGRAIYEAPVALRAPEQPLGTHLLLLQGEPSAGQWSVVTLKAPSTADGRTATSTDILDRLDIAAHVRLAIGDRLTAGSSLIVTDSGSERETGLMTDFIVLTR